MSAKRSQNSHSTSGPDKVADDDLAQALIDTSVLEARPGVYFIGNYSGRINFFAQQTRALNLVRALIKKALIEPGDSVAVVGGGLAGVTVAIALLQKDVVPELFEQNHTLLRYQKNTATRHVHPSVNFWPDMPLFPSTNFPFLNWYEGTPAEIISAVKKQIDERFKNFRFKASSRVTATEREEQNIFLKVTRWTPEKETSTREGPYKAVIVACGFGLERRPPDLPPGVPHSYWHNDDVLPPANPTWTLEHVMVSGNGDGGLIDIIRASLERFDNGREIVALAKTLDTTIMRRAVTNLMAKESQGGDSYWEQQGAFEAYISLPTNPEFESRLKDNLSRDFRITLNSPVAGLFSPMSSVIHRVIVAHLIKLGRVTTVIGKLLSSDWSSQPVKLRVGVKHDDGREEVTWEGTATRVIVRWGAEGALDWMNLSEAEVQHLKTRQRMAFANSLKQSWPTAFYDNAKNFPPIGSADYLSFYKPQAHRFFAEKGASTAIGINETQQQLHYVVLCDSDAVVAELPETFFGVPIEGKRQLSAQLSGGQGGFGAPGHGVAFRPGIGVRTSEDKLLSTLSCFAETTGLRLGAIATLHGRSAMIGELVRIDTGLGDQAISAELFRGAALYRKAPNFARPDVGLFRLPDNLQVTFSPDKDHIWTRVATRQEIYNYLGTEVLHSGLASGLTIGKLELCEIGGLQIYSEPGQAIQYEGLMAIRGRSGKFSRAGDSGSVVFSRSGGVLLGMILATNEDMTFAVPLVDVLAALDCQALLGIGPNS
jgi:hypothetical protein